MKISEIIAKLKEAQKTHGDATVKMNDFDIERVEVNPRNKKDEVSLGIVVDVG